MFLRTYLKDWQNNPVLWYFHKFKTMRYLRLYSHTKKIEKKKWTEEKWRVKCLQVEETFPISTLALYYWHTMKKVLVYNPAMSAAKWISRLCNDLRKSEWAYGNSSFCKTSDTNLLMNTGGCLTAWILTCLFVVILIHYWVIIII